MNTPSVDTARARRALSLQVEELEDGSFLVTGGAEPHVVRGKRCDCTDSVHHEGPCKHRLAVYLHRQLDERVRAALAEAVGRARP